MANDKIKGLTITGRLKESGITLYIRKGKPLPEPPRAINPNGGHASNSWPVSNCLTAADYGQGSNTLASRCFLPNLQATLSFAV